MRDSFDEVADMMASSLSVGPYATREEIITKLGAKFKTEAELLETVRKITAKALKLGPDAVMLIQHPDKEGAYFVVRNK